MRNRLVSIIATAMTGIALLNAQEAAKQNLSETPKDSQAQVEKTDVLPREYLQDGDFAGGIYLYKERTKAGNGSFTFYSQFPNRENGDGFGFSDRVVDGTALQMRPYTLTFTNNSFVAVISGRASPLYTYNCINRVSYVEIRFPTGGSWKVSQSDQDMQSEFPGRYKSAVLEGAGRMYFKARHRMEWQLCEENVFVTENLFSVNLGEEQE